MSSPHKGHNPQGRKMSSRQLLKPQSVVTNGDLSDDLVSLITNINMISILSYTLNWTGTPTGTFNVEACNDYVPSPAGVLDDPINAGTWVPLTLSTTVSAVGSDGSAFIDIDTMGSAWVRLTYTSGSGVGVLNATIAGKCA